MPVRNAEKKCKDTNFGDDKMTDITAEIEKAINDQDNLFLKEIIDSIPPRKHNAYIQWLMVGVMCYGNITLGEYKKLSKERIA